MKSCYYCCGSLNDSKEHIIPKGIGGILTSKDILCRSCNGGDNVKGNNKLSQIDAFFCKNVNFFRHFFKPKSKKPNNNFVFKDGTIGDADGHISKAQDYDNLITKQEDGQIKVNVNFLNSNPVEFKKETETLKEELRKRLKNEFSVSDIEINRVIAEIEVQIQNTPLQPPPILVHEARFNENRGLFIGFLKMTIEFAIFSEVAVKYLQNPISLLKRFEIKEREQINTELAKVSTYFTPKNTYPEDKITHTLILKGSSAEGILYCLVSLFGFLNIIILLNTEYDGNDIEKIYCYDLTSKSEIEIKPALDYTKQEIFDILLASNDNKKYEELWSTMHSSMDNFMSLLSKSKNCFFNLNTEKNKILSDIEYMFNSPDIVSKDSFYKKLNDLFYFAPKNEILNTFIETTYKRYCEDRFNDIILQTSGLFNKFTLIISSVLSSNKEKEEQFIKNLILEKLACLTDDKIFNEVFNARKEIMVNALLDNVPSEFAVFKSTA